MRCGEVRWRLGRGGDLVIQVPLYLYSELE
jgi:hypothetical protein